MKYLYLHLNLDLELELCLDLGIGLGLDSGLVAAESPGICELRVWTATLFSRFGYNVL